MRVCLERGAGGGVVEAIRLTDFEYIGHQPHLWTSLSDGQVTEEDADMVPIRVAPRFVLEAGDARTLYLILEPSEAPKAPRKYAEHLRGLRGIRFVIEWSFYRSRALPLPRSLRRRRRRPVTRRLPVEFDLTSFREGTIRQWRAGDHHHRRLANIAEGKPPDEGIG